jgi:serine protease
MSLRPRFSLLAIVAITLGLALVGTGVGAIETIRPDLPVDSNLAVIYDTSGMIGDQVLIEFRSVADARTAQSFNTLPGVVWDSSMQYRPVARYRIVDGSTPFQAITRLRNLSNIAEVYPNYRRSIAMTPNDPYFNMQKEEIEVSKIPEAWDIETGSNDVLVGIIDTGVDTNHPDLIPNLVLPGINVREDGSDVVTDDSGHGTAVAGVIGAVGNNGIGVAGINWKVRMLPIRACGGPLLDCDLFDEVDAIDAAREAGVNVINMSIGGVGTISIEEQAVTAAHNAGIVICAAAGNANPGRLYVATGDPQTDRQNLYYPAALPEVIGVGAVDNTGSKADFSNYGESILDLMAPGVDIVTTVPQYKCYLYEGNGPPYGLASGTSFATPMVSGAAALILAHYPGLSPDAVLARLETSAFPMEGPDNNGNGINDYYGYGILNLVGSLSPATSTGNNFMRVGVSADPLIPGDVLVMVQAYVQFDEPPMVNWSIKEAGIGASFQLQKVETRENFYIGRFDPAQGGTVNLTISAFYKGAPVPKVNVVYVLAD